MSDEKPKPLPYFDKGGDIVIPFDSDKKYHYWAGGQLLSKTIEEIKALNGEPAPLVEDPEILRKRQAIVEQYQAFGREALERREAEDKGKKRRLPKGARG